MEARTITNVLLAIIILILSYRWFYPTWKAKQIRKAREKEERLRIEVEPFYQEYLQKRKALRDKYDPERKLPQFAMNDPRMSKEYIDEVAALTEAYKGVLVVKFGDSILMK
jgi:hypothetical protein